jgi:hypothetical protein
MRATTAKTPAAMATSQRCCISSAPIEDKKFIIFGLFCIATLLACGALGVIVSLLIEWRRASETKKLARPRIGIQGAELGTRHSITKIRTNRPFSHFGNFVPLFP